MLAQNKINLKFQEQADPESLSLLTKLNNSIILLLTLVRGIKVDLPSVFHVIGRVSVDRIESMPAVTVTNFPDLRPTMSSFNDSITRLQLQTLKAIEGFSIVMPDTVKIGNEVKIMEWRELLDAMEELKKGFNLLLAKDGGSGTGTSFVEVTNFPQPYIPTPVTNISINALRGFANSTTTTVTSALTKLPSYGQLFNRRALIIFNNSASITIYVGGSGVTSSNGLPVLAQSYSPVIDAGYDMTIYGVTASGSADARVFEVSNDQTANVQE